MATAGLGRRRSTGTTLGSSWRCQASLWRRWPSPSRHWPIPWWRGRSRSEARRSRCDTVYPAARRVHPLARRVDPVVRLLSLDLVARHVDPVAARRVVLGQGLPAEASIDRMVSGGRGWRRGGDDGGRWREGGTQAAIGGRSSFLGRGRNELGQFDPCGIGPRRGGHFG
jgi:hypothetical protein